MFLGVRLSQGPGGFEGEVFCSKVSFVLLVSSVLVSFVLVLRAWGCGRSSKRRTWMIASPFGHPPPFQSKKSQSSPSYYLIQKLKIYSTKYFLAISFLYNKLVRHNQFNSCLHEAPKNLRFQCSQCQDSPVPCCQDRQHRNTCSSLFHLSSLGSRKLAFHCMTINN